MPKLRLSNPFFQKDFFNDFFGNKNKLFYICIPYNEMILALCIILTVFYFGNGFVLRKNSVWLSQTRIFDQQDIPEWSKYVIPDASIPDITNKLRYEHPSGILRDTRLSSDQDSNLHLQFLGTASCVSSRTRGVSSLGLRYKGDVWLFDCGEGAQNHLKGSKLKVGNLRGKIHEGTSDGGGLCSQSRSQETAAESLLHSVQRRRLTGEHEDHVGD